MTLLFPAPPGRDWPLKRTPIWKTLRQASISGQETRQALWSYPQYRYELGFAGLRSSVALPEWQTLAGLFNQVAGSAGIFAFNDVQDMTATQQSIGVGDGTTPAFQLVRALGGFVEPVFAPTSVTLQQSDWQGVTTLLPTSRTNFITKSLPIPANGWSGGDGALTSLSATAPDGSGTVGRYTENNTSNTGHQMFFPGDPLTLAVGTQYTQSIWCKPAGTGSKRYLQALLNNTAFASYGGATFDVTGSGAVTYVSSPTGANVSAAIIPATGGWFRCCITFTPTISASNYYTWRCGAAGNDIFGNYMGDGTSGLQLWGGQLENGSAAGAYIPTSGSAGTVTDYALGNLGVINMTAAPAAGTSLLWSGTFNWLCRFDADEMPFQQDMAGLWSLRPCTFSTVKL